jgi:DNA recombination protein RmuC
MEMIYLLIGCMAGGILGAVILYFALKSSMVSRSSYDELNALFIRNKSDFENSNLKIQDLQENINREKESNTLQQDLLDDLKNEFSKNISRTCFTEHQFQELKQISTRQSSQIDTHIIEKQVLYAKNSELSAKNESLQKSLDTQKKKFSKYRKNQNFSLKIWPIKS